MPQVLVDALAQCRNLEELAVGCYNVADIQMQAIVALNKVPELLRGACGYRTERCVPLRAGPALPKPLPPKRE
jgi:hypothetical protein